VLNTSVGVRPWLVVVSPIPRPGNITASTATIVATMATAVEALNARSLLIVFPPDTSTVFKCA
jgi:hypothetical protein